MKKYLTFILCALSLCTYGFLQIAPHFPYWIETYYARGLNHYTTMVISHLTGLFPFSVVEIGTYTLILYVIIHILYRLYHIFKSLLLGKGNVLIGFFKRSISPAYYGLFFHLPGLSTIPEYL